MGDIGRETEHGTMIPEDEPGEITEPAPQPAPIPVPEPVPA